MQDNQDYEDKNISEKSVCRIYDAGKWAAVVGIAAAGPIIWNHHFGWKTEVALIEPGPLAAEVRSRLLDELDAAIVSSETNALQKQTFERLKVLAENNPEVSTGIIQRILMESVEAQKRRLGR